MINCVIIDDEIPAINVLISHIKKIPGISLVGTTTNPIDGIDLINKSNPDLVFVDIEMEGMSGIDVMQKLKSELLVIFCTAHPEFAVASYELRAVDYLLKPIEFRRFHQAVRSVAKILQLRRYNRGDNINNDHIFVKTGQRGKLLRIDFDDIDLVEGMSNYVAFHMGTTKILVYLTMRELEERLPSSRFIRVHKSYIVSLNRIIALENNEIILKGMPRRIPIGMSYKEALLEGMRKRLVC